MLRDRNLVPNKKEGLPKSYIIIGIVLGLLIAFLVRAAIHSWIAYPYTIKDNRMAPGLKQGQGVTIWHGYETSDLQRGQILLLQHPAYSDEERYFLARLIGLPGDQIQIHQRKVYINNQIWSNAEELAVQVAQEKQGPALQGGSQKRDQMPAMILKEGHIFVLADNRMLANDSRQLGALPMEAIRGIVSPD